MSGVFTLSFLRSVVEAAEGENRQPGSLIALDEDQHGLFTSKYGTTGARLRLYDRQGNLLTEIGR